MLDKITIDSFKDIEGTEAQIVIMDGPNITVKVEKIVAGKCRGEDMPDTCRKVPFTVLMSGPGVNQAPDGTYDVDFQKIGLMKGVYIDNKSDDAEGPPEQVGPEGFKSEAPDGADGQSVDAGPKSSLDLPGDRIVYEIIFT